MENNTSSRFTGNTFMLLLLIAMLYLGTIFSLGIAYPWLMCVCYRWEIKNTVVCGRRQYFDGRGGDLFKNYIKWLLLTIVTLSIYKLWLSKNVMVWKISHTHFLNGTYTADNGNYSANTATKSMATAAQNGKNTSYYHCRIVEKVLMLIKYYALIICTLTFGYCWAYCYKTRWMLEHTAIDGTPLSFDGKGAQYLGRVALAFLLVLVTLGIFVLWVPVWLKKWEVKHTITADVRG